MKIRIIIAALLFSFSAQAQTQPSVRQSGAVTSGHTACWLGNQVIGDTGCGGGGGGGTLGASASATSPQRSGDATTGLFSAAPSTVSIATGGVEAITVSPTQTVGIGSSLPQTALTVVVGAGNYDNPGTLPGIIIQNSDSTIPTPGVFGGYPSMLTLHGTSAYYYQITYEVEGFGAQANFVAPGGGMDFDAFDATGTYAGTNILLPYGGLLPRSGYPTDGTPGIYSLDYNTTTFGLIKDYANPALNTPVMTMTNAGGTGAVGIGTTTPAYPLDIWFGVAARGVPAVDCSAGTVNPATMVITNGIVTHC